ncbi:ferric reductase like transmembrane component [Moesziomyces antarcticus]|uniref:Ferric reductase like transmembrane component n=2 Tax=Pseudozyma antarctica TaxID=84753 RepID=A0A081CH50_PSEA2|nr:ferric reductase like transmembrane component [Moesziomyces antarcticus]GAK65996.1 ferric reductase like transmembrane component [Moesziomyces antarcticus]SPO46770.1 related to ferric reductase [Moesziomyces antarcticus]
MSFDAITRQAPNLVARHAQNFSEAAVLQPHWGYLDRALPCSSGAAVCAYLDLVYSAHDRGMIYAAVFWLLIFAILFIWAIARWCRRSLQGAPIPKADKEQAGDSVASPQSTFQKASKATTAAFRSYLLPNCKGVYFFNRVTRTQVVVLAIISAYMLIFSFVGMTYRSWSVPTKGSSKNTIRSTLGPFADRVGVLAFALTPLSILLASRESLLSVCTGLPYHHFNFLHRWVGHIIFAQSAIHTIGWCIIEIRLYQPQPAKALQLVQETYLIWGIVAMTALLALWVLSTPWCRRRLGYEFFRKAHYVLAMLFIGACWGHWQHLKVFLLPSLLLWGVDRALRLLRTACIHYGVLQDGSVGFSTIRSSFQVFDDAQHGDVVRLDFEIPHSGDGWKVGQHFFLTFTETSIWQSHPFTPLSTPASVNQRIKHSYLIRAKGGETKKLAAKLRLKAAGTDSTGVILSGPYGGEVLDTKQLTAANVLCVSGGTGVTFTLPVLTAISRDPLYAHRKVELIWAVKRRQDIAWIQDELLALLKLAPTMSVRIFVTGSAQTSSQSTSHGSIEKSQSDSSSLPGEDVSSSLDGAVDAKGASIDPILLQCIADYARPSLEDVIPTFLQETDNGATKVYVSGPDSMTCQARSIVAAANSPSKVLKGNQSCDVELITDERFD